MLRFSVVVLASLLVVAVSGMNWKGGWGGGGHHGGGGGGGE